MKLSILIATLNEPFYINGLKRLNNILDPQIERYSGEVEKKINDKGRSMTTGEKRNELIKGTTGEYFVFIDSDDIIPVFYLDEVMNALESNPDVVTFKGYMTTDKTNRQNFFIRLGSGYFTKNGIHYRWPNHITVMKRERVQNVLFPHITKQEDYEWSKQIHNKKLLNSEVYIDKDLYIYDFISYNKRK